ncbi:GIY-YIG nuclease family protein [Microbacterium sp. JZ31]|uniref:GIY-YIG nuclease family protein n=1 Tax=Microbacterium sp. JZ31 TaxID=1906274 RepID=UPI0019331310|nr:GIY-YIG nuclease family protein [Microbacterium sp. JZ31]
MSTSRVAECAVAGCPRPLEPGAPAPLCAAHLREVAEWREGAAGVTDLLPSPCALCGARLGVRWPSGWLCAVCEWRQGDVVDGELPPPRIDVVYYVRYGDRVKIGTSAQPRRRLAALVYDELLAFERGDRLVERRRHEQFADERFARTEWFRLSGRLRAHAAALSAGVDDPWRLHTRWVSEALALRA